MSSLAFIDPEHDQRWDEFVESHPDGLICHLSGWRQVLERSFSHIKGYFPVLADPGTGDIRAGLPLYLVRSPFLGNRLVSIPFATLSDPLVSTEEDLATLLETAIQLATQLRVCRLEVRALSSARRFGNSGFARSDFYKNHFLPLDQPPEDLVKRFHPSCVRRQLKRCQQNGLVLKTTCNYEDLRSLFYLYLKTRKRLGLPPQPFRYFEQLWQVFRPTGKLQILAAYYHGKPLASLLLLRFRERVSWEFIGEDQAYRHLNPTHFLLWQAIQRSYAEGFKLFDFGRTSPNNLGLMDFKRRWGTQVIDLPQFCYPGTLNRNSLSMTSDDSLKYQLIRFLARKSPRSLFPYLGEFCYRHMG